jgi:cytochrome bd-type quinol oxidase subunit 2
MLILGSQVLLGVQYRAVFEKGFEKLPQHAQYAKLGGLGLMLVAVSLLMWPGAYHQIVDDGEDTHELQHFATAVMSLALLPFALGLGVDFFVAVESLVGRTPGVVAGAAAALAALLFWYGLEAARGRERQTEVGRKKAMSDEQEGTQDQGTKVKTKIEQVLTEIRVVLPGAQALLGFGFMTFLTESFEKLPTSSKYAHLASLSLITLAVVLMMTPAAYHRLVERGEATEHFHRFASRMLLASMVPLALGISGDFFVVARKVTESAGLALALAAASLALFYGSWFAYTLYRRARKQAGAGVSFGETART